jgi:hypothetical protein
MSAALCFARRVRALVLLAAVWLATAPSGFT